MEGDGGRVTCTCGTVSLQQMKAVIEASIVYRLLFPVYNQRYSASSTHSGGGTSSLSRALEELLLVLLGLLPHSLLPPLHLLLRLCVVSQSEYLNKEIARGGRASQPQYQRVVASATIVRRGRE